MDIENKFKVKLTSQSPGSTRRVVFDVTPDLTESAQVDYKSVQPVHMPGTIYVYGSTSSRTFDISNIRLVSRSQEEASNNLKILQTLRSWTKNVFGEGSVDDNTINVDNRSVLLNSATSTTFEEQSALDVLGAPPEVLLLTAYSNETNLSMQHLNRIPVVIQQVSIPYPSDQDYIPSTEGVPMPMIMTLSMTLLESHSPLEFENFSLADYRNGILKNF